MEQETLPQQILNYKPRSCPVQNRKLKVDLQRETKQAKGLNLNPR
jgi:hypothetical protein